MTHKARRREILEHHLSETDYICERCGERFEPESYGDTRCFDCMRCKKHDLYFRGHCSECAKEKAESVAA